MGPLPDWDGSPLCAKSGLPRAPKPLSLKDRKTVSGTPRYSNAQNSQQQQARAKPAVMTLRSTATQDFEIYSGGLITGAALSAQPMQAKPTNIIIQTAGSGTKLTSMAVKD
jgi:hypothetical protein